VKVAQRIVETARHLHAGAGGLEGGDYFLSRGAQSAAIAFQFEANYYLVPPTSNAVISAARRSATAGAELHGVRGAVQRLR
jgi:hypothetical protein